VVFGPVPGCVIAALAVAAPALAVADDNQNNNSGAQNSNGLPFTGNDPPTANFNSAHARAAAVLIDEFDLKLWLTRGATGSRADNARVAMTRVFIVAV
jgi:hypothetical protein